MKQLTTLILSLILSLYAGVTLGAPVPADSMQVSLLTVSPGTEVYEVFGHTALRIQDPQNKRDWVFNYGLFDFNAPNFIYRFAKGETDYLLGISEFQQFMVGYAMRGSEVKEQIIEMNAKESEALFQALMVNYQPENRVYRYNFFYDNCATRPRDRIEDHMTRHIIYPDLGDEQTFRTWVHNKTHTYPWLTFGIDLAIGSKADLLATPRKAMFLPSVLFDSFQGATFKKGNVPLVKEEVVLLESDPEMVDESSFTFPSPTVVGWTLCILTLLLTIYDFRRTQPSRWFDSILFTIAGIAGTILFYLNFFSLHPAVDANYNCFWLQPFHLLVGVGIWVKSIKNRLFYYHFANFVLIMALFVMWSFIPQRLNPAFIPFMMVLALRSGLRIGLFMKTLHR